MIQTKVFSQRDRKWANDKMGESGLTLHNYGCTVTSLASLLCALGYDETPKTVNRKLSAHGGYYKKTALILWSAVSRIWTKLKFVKRAYNYNNLEVIWYVYGKRIPVLVEVNGAKIGAARHWVLFVGDKKMIDPWYGRISVTNYYPTTGYTLYSV